MPAYVGLAALAYELSIDTETAEQWVSAGILPQPIIRKGKRRWNWAAVERGMDGGDENSRVYFVECHGFIKIGFTTDFERRMKAIASWLPFSFTVLHHVPGDFDLETDFHRKFKHLRVRGEWFRKEPELTDFIDQMKNGG